MHLLNFVLLAVGVACLAGGILRARRPWRRYQELKYQAANVARYEAWRGGVRDEKPTGAAVAISNARRDLVVSFLVGLIGVVALIAGFLPS